MDLTQSEITVSLYRRRKDSGLCPKCGKSFDGKKYFCPECAEKQNAYQRENRKFYIEHHLCSVCGKEKVFGTEKICLECREKANSRRKLLAGEQKKQHDEHFKQQQKALYNERKKEGICTRCGKRKAAPNRVKCSICLRKNAELKRKSGIARSERPSYGLCYTCGKPLDRDGRMCKKCVEKIANNLPKERSNDFWKQDNKIVFGIK